jgi:pentatricopeptide repeat protein
MDACASSGEWVKVMELLVEMDNKVGAGTAVKGEPSGLVALH